MVPEQNIVESGPRTEYCGELSQNRILWRVVPEQNIVESGPRTEYCGEWSQNRILWRVVPKQNVVDSGPRTEYCGEWSQNRGSGVTGARAQIRTEEIRNLYTVSNVIAEMKQ